MKILTTDEAVRLVDRGYRFTMLSLYEAQHAPKGTEFVKLPGGLYRVHPPKCDCLRCKEAKR
jgi:hypothetical protein